MNGYQIMVESNGMVRTMIATGSMTLDECVNKLLELGFKFEEIIIKPV